MEFPNQLSSNVQDCVRVRHTGCCFSGQDKNAKVPQSDWSHGKTESDTVWKFGSNLDIWNTMNIIPIFEHLIYWYNWYWHIYDIKNRSKQFYHYSNHLRCSPRSLDGQLQKNDNPTPPPCHDDQPHQSWNESCTQLDEWKRIKNMLLHYTTFRILKKYMGLLLNVAFLHPWFLYIFSNAKHVTAECHS